MRNDYSTPSMDDRFDKDGYQSRFQDIVDEAKRRIPLYCPEWTDHNVSDPGVTLIELFAWMYDGLLFRMDKIPEDAFAQFLRLIGMPLSPPIQAKVDLHFSLTTPSDPADRTIKADTQVRTPHADGSPPVVFTTTEERIFHPAVVGALCVLNASQKVEGRVSPEDKYCNLLKPGTALSANLLEPTRPDGSAALFPPQQTPVGERDRDTKPQIGDCFCVGFKHNMSHCVIRLSFGKSAETADTKYTTPPAPSTTVPPEKAVSGGLKAGENPYLWKVSPLTPDASISTLPDDYVLEPLKGGFSEQENETVVLRLPAMGKRLLDSDRSNLPNELQEELYWVFCELNTNSLTAPPRISRFTVETVGGFVPAEHFVLVEEETLGQSDGRQGQRFVLAQTPILAPNNDDEQCLVSIGPPKVTANPDQRATPDKVLWEHVADFSDSRRDSRHYCLDRTTGEITFGPTLPLPDGSVYQFGQIPITEHQIVMRKYRSGGGAIGNVPAGSLTVLPELIAGISKVENPASAVGGRNAQTLANARHFIPLHLRTRSRAVTKEDYEAIACEDSRIARAFCVTCDLPENDPLFSKEEGNDKKLNKVLAAPGSVRVLIVPSIENMPPETPAAPALVAATDILSIVKERLTAASVAGCKVETASAHDYFVTVTVTATLKLSDAFAGRDDAARNKRQEESRELAKRALYQYLRPDAGGQRGKGWEWGSPIQLGPLRSVLESAVPNLDFIEKISISIKNPLQKNEENRSAGNDTPVAIMAFQLVDSGDHQINFV